MKYILVSIIVFILGLGLLLYGGIGYQVWKHFQPAKHAQVKKSFHTLVRPTVVPDDTRSFRGNISELTETGFVVKSKDGSADILITESTSYVGGEREELVKGKEVVVSGEIDKNGIITANVIVSGKAIGKRFIKR